MRYNKISLCLLFAISFGFVYFASPAMPVTGHLGELSNRVYLSFIYGNNQPRWVGLEGGSVVSMAVDPTNGNIVYAGAYGSGVFKSVDGGAHWQYASQGITNVYIHNLIIDPVETNRIYAGTYRSGVFRSDDGGQTWVSASNGMAGNPIVYALATNVRENHNMIYAGTRDSNVDLAGSGPPWRGILYKSWDYGNTWTPVLYNIGGTSDQDWVYSLAVDPVNAGTVLAATHEHGIYRTDSYGGGLNEWFPSNSGINDLSARALVFDIRGTNVLTGVFDRDSIYRSTDDGKHWNLSNGGTGWARIFPNALSVTNANFNTIYAGSMSDAVGTGVRGVLRSDNGGQTWIRTGLSNENIYTVRASSTNASVVYAGTQNDGLFKSINGGTSWTLSMSGIINTNVTGVTHPTANLIIISDYGKGVFWSADEGQSWNPMNTGLVDLNVNGLYQSPDRPYVLYALTSHAGLKRVDLSTGINWGIASLGGNSITTQTWETAGVIPATNPAILTRAGEDPYKVLDPAEDELLTMEMRNGNGSEARNLAQPETVPTNAALISMAFAPSDPKVAYVGTNGSGVYVSKDGGLNWGQSSIDIKGMIVRGISVSPNNPLFACASTSTVGSFYCTGDGGVSWSKLGLPRSNLSTYSIIMVKEGSDPSVVYLGTSDGLWKLQSNLWTQVGLMGSQVTALSQEGPDGILYAGTANGAYASYAPGQWQLLSPMTLGHTIQTIAYNLFSTHQVYFGANTHGLFIFQR